MLLEAMVSSCQSALSVCDWFFKKGTNVSHSHTLQPHLTSPSNSHTLQPLLATPPYSYTSCHIYHTLQPHHTATQAHIRQHNRPGTRTQTAAPQNASRQDLNQHGTAQLFYWLDSGQTRQDSQQDMYINTGRIMAKHSDPPYCTSCGYSLHFSVWVTYSWGTAWSL